MSECEALSGKVTNRVGCGDGERDVQAGSHSVLGRERTAQLRTMDWHLTHLRPSEGIRWAVGEQNGRRSSTFRFWGNKKGDFYLAVRTLGGAMKTSLHRDGNCHTGLTGEYAKANGVPERHMDKWSIPLDRLAKGIQVSVAEGDLDQFEDADHEPMRWLRPPKVGCMALVGVLVLPASQAAALGASWPGADARVEPVGVLGAGGRTAYVLHWEVPMTSEQTIQLNTLRRSVHEVGTQVRDRSGRPLRAILVGRIGEGDRTLFDVACA